MVTTYLRRFYTSFTTHIIDVPTRLMAFLSLLLLIAAPVAKLPINILMILATAYLMAIFAASWDLLVGRTGQISLGHALFFGIGGYATALLNVRVGWPIWATISTAILLAFVAAVGVGYLTLRVKGPYLALVSMALPLIFTGILLAFKNETGGERGIWGLSGIFTNMTLKDMKVAEYYFSLILLLVSAVILYKVANSHTGIVLVSILDDELASKACGINVTKYKVMALAISGIFAGLAGSVYAHLMGAISLHMLAVDVSFMVVIMTIFGGLGTIYGGIVGAFIIQLLDGYVLTDLFVVGPEWRLLLYIAVVIILIMKWPRGVSRFVTDQISDLSKEREIEERGPHIWKTYKKKKK
jgi:branched-chain amino acid transport system permease protein